MNRFSMWLFLILSINITQVFAYQNTSSLSEKACYKSISTEDAILKKTAKRQWPNDYSMQRYEIKQQKSAYKELCSRPIPFTGKKGRAYEQIRQDAWNTWYPDFGMILFRYKKQINDYDSLQSGY